MVKQKADESSSEEDISAYIKKETLKIK